MIFYETPEIRIDWDEEVRCVSMVWKGFLSGDQFRNSVNKGLELLANKQGHKWLADLTQMGVISMDDQKWADEDWFPRAVKSGMRFMAMIRPQKVIPQFSVRDVITKVDDLEIQTEYFSNMEDAKAWLRSRPSC